MLQLNLAASFKKHDFCEHQFLTELLLILRSILLNIWGNETIQKYFLYMHVNLSTNMYEQM